MVKLTEAMIARFWAKVDRRAADECWPWTGVRKRHKGAFTYGIFYTSKTSVLGAHRAAWLASYGGDDLLPGLLVCHSCDNPQCCNPAHLWLGTKADNNRDRSEKGRTRTGKRAYEAVRYRKQERHPSAKLTAVQVSEIRSDRRPLSVIGQQYGVDPSTVSRIRRGKAWYAGRAPGHRTLRDKNAALIKAKITEAGNG